MEIITGWIGKVLIIFGLGMTCAGLLCLIQAGYFKADNGRKYHSFPPVRPELHKVGWVLMIGGVCIPNYWSNWLLAGFLSRVTGIFIVIAVGFMYFI